MSAAALARLALLLPDGTSRSHDLLFLAALAAPAVLAIAVDAALRRRGDAAREPGGAREPRRSRG